MRSGFTLIELLVVISIIGVLSTFATISLNDARAKSRDAKRLNDVRQMANALAVEGTQGVGAQPLEGSDCGAVGAVTDPRNCTGPGIVAQFQRFSDPSEQSTLCTGSSDVPCQYALAEGSTDVQNAAIYFFLEQNAAGLGEGLHIITPEGSIVDLD